ncbi:hypothetical protein [Dysgonomonas reticulitermitis]
MKNLCLLLISLTIIPMIWFSSCTKTEDNNDNIPPVIDSLSIRFNFNDTIKWQNTSITINDTLTKEGQDTLVVGKVIYMSGRFFTNKERALSGYKVDLYYKLINESQKEINDTLTAVGAGIFGKTDTIIRMNRLITIPDFISIMENNESGVKVPVIYYPVEGDHTLNVVCGDIYGKRDSIQFPVKLLSRKSIYDSRKK